MNINNIKDPLLTYQLTREMSIQTDIPKQQKMEEPCCDCCGDCLSTCDPKDCLILCLVCELFATR